MNNLGDIILKLFIIIDSVPNCSIYLESISINNELSDILSSNEVFNKILDEVLDLLSNKVLDLLSNKVLDLLSNKVSDVLSDEDFN